MSNKLKKKNKSKKINQPQNNILSKEQSEKLNLIKKHHIFFWLILFFPVGIFFLFKYKILPKWATIVLTISFILLSIGIVYCIINPYRVINNNVEQKLNDDFSEQLGNIISIENYNTIENYYIYDVITNKGRYDVYVNEKHSIEAIKQTKPDSSEIFTSDTFENKYKNIYSEIIKFINNNELDISNNIEEIIETTDTSQTLKIDNKNYTFNIAFENVDTISCDGEHIYTNPKVTLRLNQEVYEKISKKFPSTKNIKNVSFIDFYDDYYVTYFTTEEDIMYELLVYQNGRIVINIEDTYVETNEE